jgi:transposase
MDIVNAYAALGSYRAAAALCRTTHKTVKRVVERRRTGTEAATRRLPRPRNTEGVRDLIAERVQATDGRITAKRLLPVAQAAGYTGSARNFRRAVAEAKAAWRQQRRTYRPWVPVPGEHLVIDWGTERGLHLFCAVLPWSRYRFVRFATDERRATTLALLAECFEDLGGVPAVVLADRMAGLRAGTVANVVVPHPDYVRLAAHYGFRPDFCEAGDAESKGVVEALVGYAQTDLVIPAGGWESLAAANDAARAWCAEVNGRAHTEIAAIPAERLATERGVLRPLPTLRAPLRQGAARKVDKLSTIRFGAARYSVPHELVGATVRVLAQEGAVLIEHEGREVARHRLVAPGEVALEDAHYGGPARRPARAVRPGSAAETAFLALGPAAERFLRAAAAAGTVRLDSELRAIVALELAWGRAALLPALERAVTFHRFTAADVRAILAAGPGVPTPTPPGPGLALPHVPPVPTRALSAYALEALLSAYALEALQ